MSNVMSNPQDKFEILLYVFKKWFFHNLRYTFGDQKSASLPYLLYDQHLRSTHHNSHKIPSSIVNSEELRFICSS